jgi:hypothetical protein
MDNTHAGHGVDNALGKLFHGTIVSLSAAALASLVKGVPEGNFERSHAALRHALTNETLGLGIYGELSAAIRASDIPQVKVLSESALAKIKTDARTTDLSPLLEQGVDSVLEIGMTEIAFEMKKGFNPDISFAPQVTVNVRRVLDGAVLHTKFFEYRGAERKFTDWGAEDARSFRYEMRQAEREFARVMLDYFLSPPNVTQ